jgi:hypothetical protein
VALPDPVIHLYWAYALARVEKMFQETPFPTGVCGAQAEREYVTLHPNKITCPSCRERAKARSGERAGEMSHALSAAPVCQRRNPA